MKRVLCIVAALVLLSVTALPVGAKTYTVSVNQFVEHPALDAVLKGFQDSMNKKLDVDYKVHNAQANMGTATQVAQVIAGEKPDLVLAIATPSAQACAQIIKKAPHMAKTPLIFSAVTDPKGAGLVKNLDKPGKNITGVSDLTPVDKHLLMINEFHPGIKRVGVVYNAGEANSKTLVDLLKKAGKEFNIKIVEATAAKSSDVFAAAKSLVGRADAVYVPTDNTVVSALESLVKVCEDSDMPLYAADVDSVPRGAVAALGFDYYKHGVQTGEMAVKILQGQSPATTPVEFQEGMTLHLNMAAAKAQGVDVPASIKDRADKIID